MFIQYLTEQGHNVVKSERKPRKNIQYKDLGSLQLTYGFLEIVQPRILTPEML